MRRVQQQGFSLVELMIAMTLGLIVTGAILQTFIANNRSTELQRTAVALQEEGRATIDYLARYIRLAGFRETNLDAGRLSEGLKGNRGAVDDLGGHANSGQDWISSMFQASATAAGSSTINPGSITDLRDCLGRPISNADYSMNTFYVDAGSAQLLCQATTSASAPASPYIDSNAPKTESATLVGNVEELRIRYGIDTTGDGITNRYTTTPAGGDVVLVKLCLRLRSSADLVSPAAEYYSCNGSKAPASTKLERRIETTIALRNRMGG